MRHALLGLLALVISVIPSYAQSHAGQSDQEILVQLEKDWDQAFLDKNIPFIQNVLGDEFVATYDDGSRGDRAKEMSLVQEFDQQIDSSTLDGFIVKVYGDTAVVWFSRHLVGPTPKGPLSLTLQYVDVFVWRAGRWQCIESQSTKVAG